MLKQISISIVAISFLGLSYLTYNYFYENKDLNISLNSKNETIKQLEDDLSSEKDANQKLKIKISELEKNIKSLEYKISELNMKIVDIDFGVNDSSVSSAKTSISNELNISEDTLIKFTAMNRGDWTLSDSDKKKLLSLFKNEKNVIFEIIPIIDEKLYKDDNKKLKQVGLSRQRASTVAALLKSLNSNNKIFISTEILTSKNERGFIIKKVNLK